MASSIDQSRDELCEEKVQAESTRGKNGEGGEERRRFVGNREVWRGRGGKKEQERGEGEGRKKNGQKADEMKMKRRV